jgi:hypothetical protein
MYSSVPPGMRWLRERQLLGDIVLQRLRKTSTCLGRTSAISKEHCKMLVLSMVRSLDSSLRKQIVEFTCVTLAWPTRQACIIVPFPSFFFSLEFL